jgi:uncharacterized membrane protein
VAGIIIGLAAIEATVKACLLFFRPNSAEESKEEIRLELGRWLSLALEFELASTFYVLRLHRVGQMSGYWRQLWCLEPSLTISCNWR